jgi:hypothetical protein
MKKNYFPLVLLLAFICSCAAVHKKIRYIELHSRDCSICARMLPVIEAAQAGYGSQVDVESYGSGSDTGEELVKKYNVKKYPANLFLDGEDRLFFRYDGLLDAKSVEEILGKQIKSISLTETAK